MAMPELPFGLTADALAAAMAESDPTRWRRRPGSEPFGPTSPRPRCIRPRCAAGPGPSSARRTPTRCSSPGPGWSRRPGPEVADQHAARLVAAGARRVIDLGCGIGSDAHGLRSGRTRVVVAVDIDPETAAVVARANLGPNATVICADAEAVAAHLAQPGDAVFADPARR